VINFKTLVFARSGSLCATCVWGTVRKGGSAKEAETFCRLLTPNTLVPFAVSECTDYHDRRMKAPDTEAKSKAAKYGFVTTLELDDQAKDKL